MKRLIEVRVLRGLGVVAMTALMLGPPPAFGATDDTDELSALEIAAFADAPDRDALAAFGVSASAKVTVEVLHARGRAGSVGSAVAEASGVIRGSVPGLLLVEIPAAAIVRLEQRSDVFEVRSPIRVDLVPTAPDDVGDPLYELAGHIDSTNAAAWHSAGFVGAGAKVGIVDYFDGSVWSAAQASGEVPAPAGTFCMVEGLTCDIWTGGSAHGVAVAEIVNEMAPGADIYIATAVTTTDLAAAVVWFDSQGVDIISRSLVAQLDGPGDGTGPLSEVVDDAVARGMVWFNAAGNHASASGTADGGYWRGSWVDANDNGWLDFSPGDEALGFFCGGVQGFRWSDWTGSGTTDYDLLITDFSTGVTVATSVRDQTAGAEAIEIPVAINCAAHPVLNLWVNLYDPGAGTSGDVLEFMVNQTRFEYSSNPYSASGPVSDSSNSGLVAVGAIDPPEGSAIAPYSSQGPTNDERIKPDISAPSCLPSFSYSPLCFNGTSAATPVAAGAAALVFGAGVETNPGSISTYLRQNATDLGVAGPDPVFGAGRLTLGAPPVPNAPPVNTALPVVSGTVEVGGVLSSTDGTWTGTDPITYTYQWQRCSGACSDIVGETGSSYVVAGGDVGFSLTVVVTGTNGAGSSEATAVETGVVPDPPTFPVNVALPVVSGSAQIGGLLSASSGTWTGTALIAHTYQWQRCDTVCSDVSSETGSSYLVALADIGWSLRVVVTATNDAGFDSSASERTAIVPPPPNQPPTVSAGSDQNITLPSAANLAGTVGDDGLPNDSLTSTWTMVSGPGSVAFDSPTSPRTTARFSTDGWFVLRLTASDGAKTASDDVHVIVAPPIDSFIDDDDSVFEADIEWMAAYEITKGCNPPTNDRFCPDAAVTRGQMAAFLVRALGLTDRLDDPFTDDDSSIFEADIERLAAAGITKGCNPPTNDRFCPDSKVTREQMAAFLVRALGYTYPGAGDLFIDDDLSIFERDIDRLATAGVTKGCNPPTNDRFCPTGYVTRGQMAALLHRALG